MLAALPEAARRHLEDLAKIGTYEYEYRSEFVRRYIGQGRAEAVLTVLAARGIDVPEPARNRIAGCVDLDQINLWLRRAVTAETVDDLFG